VGTGLGLMALFLAYQKWRYDSAMRQAGIALEPR